MSKEKKTPKNPKDKEVSNYQKEKDSTTKEPLVLNVKKGGKSSK
ncbi:hypothetical protein [Sphingobacterium lumbrici]|nr:hypothetical protein [Sphingobacterium lumbrici]